MDLNDYRFADCTLFRTPPINFAESRRAIEQALMNAWESGHTANDALHSITSNSQIMGHLVRQIDPSLSYQRTIALDAITNRTQEALDAYKLQRAEHIRGIEDTLGEAEREKQGEYLGVSSAHEQKALECNAYQKRLEEIRARIKSQLRDVGGKKGYCTIMEINDAVEGNAQPKTHHLEQLTEAVPAERREAPEKDTVKCIDELLEQEHKGRFQTLMDRIKGIFSYRPW